MKTPEGLRARGQRLWKNLNRAETSPEYEIALEACRMVDRLDGLDRILSGDAWHSVVEDPNEDGVYILVVDKAMAEARALQLALDKILSTLTRETTAAPTAAPGSPLDELRKRRAAKSAK